MSILKLTSDPFSPTADAGQLEFGADVLAFTPNGAERGIVPAEMFYRRNSNLVGADATGAQSLFGAGLTLSASTIYEFELLFILNKTVGVTSHTISFLFGGTATINNIGYYAGGTDNSSNLGRGGGTSGGFITSITAAATIFTAAITTASATAAFIVKGTVSVNAGGTFIPQYSLSAAPGGAYTTITGSYIKIKPIGPSGANVSVGTFA